MWLSKDAIRANLIAEMTPRFPARHGIFPDNLKISALGFASPESLREWGKKLNRATWFTGWFTPSEFLACVTIGPLPDSKQPNIIDLMFNTQTRPPERAASATAMLRLSNAASAGDRQPPAKKTAKKAAKKGVKKSKKGSKKAAKASKRRSGP